MLSLRYWSQCTFWCTYNTLLRSQNAFSVSGSIFSCLLFFIWMGWFSCRIFDFDKMGFSLSPLIFLDFMKKVVLSFYPCIKFCILIKVYDTTKIMKFVKKYYNTLSTHYLSVCKASTIKLYKGSIFYSSLKFWAVKKLCNVNFCFCFLTPSPYVIKRNIFILPPPLES